MSINIGKTITENTEDNISSAPPVSICTVTLNPGLLLLRTLQSIVQQDSSLFEFILVDGGSVDGSIEVALEFIRKYSINASVIVEPDEGIYDAFNKGVNNATGDYVLFLNAGDTFASPLTEIVKNMRRSGFFATVYYGDVIVHYPNTKKTKRLKPKPIRTLWYDMPFSHQGTLVMRETLKREPFSLGFLSSDHQWLLRQYLQGSSFEALHIPIAHVSSQGVADTSRIRIIIERYRYHKLLRFPLRQLLLFVTIFALAVELPKPWLKRAFHGLQRD